MLHCAVLGMLNLSEQVSPPISAKWLQQVFRFVAEWMHELREGEHDIGVIAVQMGFEIDSDGEWRALEDEHFWTEEALEFEAPYDDHDLDELVFLDEFGTPLEAERDYDLSAETGQESPGLGGRSSPSEGGLD